MNENTEKTLKKADFVFYFFFFILFIYACMHVTF